MSLDAPKPIALLVDGGKRSIVMGCLHPRVVLPSSGVSAVVASAIETLCARGGASLGSLGKRPWSKCLGLCLTF